MKQIFSSLIALNLSWIPVVALMVEQLSWKYEQLSWEQAQKSQQREPLRVLIQSDQAHRLRRQAIQAAEQGQPQRAIEAFEQVVELGRQLEDRQMEGFALLGLSGFVKRFVSSMKIRQEIGLHKRSQIGSKQLSNPLSASSTF